MTAFASNRRTGHTSNPRAPLATPGIVPTVPAMGTLSSFPADKLLSSATAIANPSAVAGNRAPVLPSLSKRAKSSLYIAGTCIVTATVLGATLGTLLPIVPTGGDKSGMATVRVLSNARRPLRAGGFTPFVRSHRLENRPVFVPRGVQLVDAFVAAATE